MKKRKSIQTIICLLAKEAPLTPYKIAQKARLSEAIVHEDIRDKEMGLERQNTVKMHSISKFAGRKRREYILSFKGIVEYLSLSLWGRFRETETEIKKFIKKYNEFCDYPLFKEHEFLAKWLRGSDGKPLGDKIYREYSVVAYNLIENPPPVYYPGPGIRGPLPGLIQHPLRDILPDKKPVILPEDEEKIWMHGYALCFIRLSEDVLPRGGVPNEVLRRFFKETIDKQKKSLAHERELLKKLEAKLLGDEKHAERKRVESA